MRLRGSTRSRSLPSSQTEYSLWEEGGVRAVVGTCMQSSSQIEISLCTSRAITRAINGNHEGSQWQSRGESMAITRAIKGP